MKTRVYKVDIANDQDFCVMMQKQGYKFMVNSVLKNCFYGINYYWIDGKYYGLLLDTLADRYEVTEFKNNKIMKTNKLEKIALGYAKAGINEEIGSIVSFMFNKKGYILNKTNSNEYSLYEECDFMPINVFYL